MSRITEELLRKRAEHNDCCLTSLEEVSLHQQELTRIEGLEALCRHLKILYLQNNIIEKMENLSKLKELEYLNLALNNVSRIENIEGCESLKKLDLTVNFVDVSDLHPSAECLAKLPQLKEIYLTGNPCEEWKGCKEYIIAHVPTLESYNGEIVTPSQRIKAQQHLPALKQSLFEAVQNRRVQLLQEEAEEAKRRAIQDTMTEEERNKQKTPYTKDVRREMYEKMYEEKEKKEKERNPEKYVEEKESPMFGKDGEIRQCNEGKFTFKLKEFEDPDWTFFELEVPKHLETSSLDVRLDPKWISVRVKKQLTQLKLSEEVIVHLSKTERSQITGALLVKMKKLQPHEFLRRTQEKEAALIKKAAQEKASQIKAEREKTLRLCEEYEKRMEKEENDVPDLE